MPSSVFQRSAAAAFAAKVPVPTPLDSAGMGDLPLAIRETAVFSATLESARAIERIAQRIREALEGTRRALEGGGEGAVSSRAAFINEMRQIMIDEGLAPFDGTQGTIKDFTSEARLRLIYDTLYDRAVGYQGWKNEQNQAVLDAAPAQELVRIGFRKVPRDWISRWSAAGGTFYEGQRMIARKDDPIWAEISRFQTPWPPFDFNSGMGLRDVLRRDAIKLGVIEPDDRIQPQAEQFTKNLQASVTDLGTAAIAYLKRTFGSLIEIVGDVARWVGSPT